MSRALPLADPTTAAPGKAGELARLAQIARIAASKGWGHYAEKLHVGKQPAAGEAVESKSDAVRLREALEELGPTFVKLGQMMAGRTDIFPEALVGELGRLQEHAEQFPALVRTVDPEFSSLDAFRAYSGRLLKQAFVPEMGVARIAQLYRFTSALREVAGDAPIALQRVLGRLERGEPLFEVRHQSGGGSVERHLLHASNRLAFALIIASIVVGSAIIIAAHAGPHIGDVPVLGILGFVVAAALGVAWAVLALKSGKL